MDKIEEGARGSSPPHPLIHLPPPNRDIGATPRGGRGEGRKGGKRKTPVDQPYTAPAGTQIPRSRRSVTPEHPNLSGNKWARDEPMKREEEGVMSKAPLAKKKAKRTVDPTSWITVRSEEKKERGKKDGKKTRESPLTHASRKTPNNHQERKEGWREGDQEQEHWGPGS